jgi:predicted kinase
LANIFNFWDKNGEYKFDASKLKQAHKWCQDTTEDWMLRGYNIVVSNTFTQEWEMKAYYDLAEKYGYQVYSIIVENRHEGVNEHGVPEDKLEQMKNRFEIKL